MPPPPPPVPGRKPNKLVGCLLGCVPVFLLFAAVMGYYVWDAAKRDKAYEADTATAKQFESFTSAKAPPANAIDDSQARYRKGRMILIDAKAGGLDGLYFTNLPAELRATSPKDLGTEVWLIPDEQFVGKYDNGSEAYKCSYDVIVYDMGRNAVVARERIEGENPPQKRDFRTNDTSAVKRWPFEKLMKFLQDLPAR